MPMLTGKALISAVEKRHRSVVNNLTVSRYRKLQATAVGQKFLNENLNRTTFVELNRSSSSKLARTAPQELTTCTEDCIPHEPPSACPLYVRFQAIVADWEVPQCERKDFLITETPIVEHDAYINKQKYYGSNVLPPLDCLGDADRWRFDVIGNVVERAVLEVMAEEHFEKLIDQMVVEEVPYFCQLEDGSPPGELFPHEDPAGLNWAIDFATGDVPCRLNCRTSKWASPLLLDFPRPEVLGSTCGWLKEPDADSMIANAPQTGAPTEEGEVDYEAFRVAAAETLDSMLLNILDDVITGKLNWTRPLSKPRSSGN